MIVLNFAHPLTSDQLAAIEALVGTLDEVRDADACFDTARPFAVQIREMIDEIGFSPRQWQTQALLINPPSYSYAAVTLLAELHGRMGHFPLIVRIRPVEKGTPPRFEVAEVIDLQQVRAQARESRRGSRQ
jgi:hypothetical protein